MEEPRLRKRTGYLGRTKTDGNRRENRLTIFVSVFDQQKREWDQDSQERDTLEYGNEQNTNGNQKLLPKIMTWLDVPNQHVRSLVKVPHRLLDAPQDDFLNSLIFDVKT